METIRTVIVEDDEKIAEIQKVFTEKISGYSIVGIAHGLRDGEEMISILEPDLVLLDIFFPDGNGIDLLWKIRAEYKKMDVILITAAKEVRFFEQGMRGGVFDYILKPLVFKRFETTLEKYRNHRCELQGMQRISQQEVDLLLQKSGQKGSAKEELPKGIDPITLQKVIACMDGIAENGVSAETAAQAIGVSRTTSRRYLEYLVAGGTVVADLDYGTQGRPERLYRRSA